MVTVTTVTHNFILSGFSATVRVGAEFQFSKGFLWF